MKLETPGDVKLWAAQINANRHLALYVKERNGLLIWKAYQEYRRHGLPVPENIMRKLDHYAEKLLLARGQTEIALALEMTSTKKGGRGGGPQGGALLKGQERARDIVEQFHTLRRLNSDSWGNSMKITELAEQVGKAFGITGNEVQVRYSQWIADCKPEQKDDVQSLVDLLNRKT